jgi:hypothetical protein
MSEDIRKENAKILSKKKEETMMKIRNIKWDIDIDDVLETIGEMTVKEVAEVLGLPEDTYADMNNSERNDYIYDVFEHSPEAKADLLCLPSDANIPDDTEEIADYLSDKYEFCVISFEIQPDFKKPMTDEELHKMIDSLSSYEQDRIYRYLWGQHVREDVISHAETIGVEIDDCIIDTVVDRYVERGDYDCNLDYWTNIGNLIEEEGGNKNEN